MITISHTRREGALIEGTRKGDGSAALIKDRGFRWSRTLGSWYLPHSRDKQASWKLEPLAQALRDAGFEVTVTVNEDDRRSFAEAEADRNDRAEDRAERYGDRADRAADNSNALHARAKQRRDAIPMGQPILIGHHSEKRDRNFPDRTDQIEGKGIAEGKRADYWVGRADAAEHYQQYRNNPGTTLRRIDRLEAEQRRVQKWLAGESADGYTRDIGNSETVAELNRRAAELQEELDYWRSIIAEAEANGFKVWGRSDFAKGDYVRAHGHWFEVVRVNPKSLTVPSILNVHTPVVTVENNAYPGMTHKIPYDKVSGRKSAEEMQAAIDQAAQTDKGQQAT